MNSVEANKKLLDAIPSSYFATKLGAPTLENNLTGKHSVIWRSVCAVNLVVAAEHGDTDAVEALDSVENQAALYSLDNDAMLLPCGKRMGECAVVLMMDSETVEALNCSEHTS